MDFRETFANRDLKVAEKNYNYLTDKEREFIAYYKNLIKPEPKDFNRLQEIAGKYKK